MKVQVTINYAVEMEFEIPDGMEEDARDDLVMEKTEDWVGGEINENGQINFETLRWLGTTVEAEGEEILEVSGR